MVKALAQKPIGTDAILEFTGVGRRSSRVSCLADLVFPIQFRAAAATETHTQLTQALTFCVTTLDTSQMLYSCFPSVKRSPHHVLPFTSCVPWQFGLSPLLLLPHQRRAQGSPGLP